MLFVSDSCKWRFSSCSLPTACFGLIGVFLIEKEVEQCTALIQKGAAGALLGSRCLYVHALLLIGAGSAGHWL